MDTREADYLVVGTGAISMGFVDVMLKETTDTTFLMVDRHGAPGGHWNDAYSFVRLHQPSAYYGVNSTPLGSDRIDQNGSNKGYFELASGPEVVAYYDRVMRETFIPSGRVTYLSMTDFKGLDDQGRGLCQSLLSGEESVVTIGKKTVDGTWFKTTVPSTHTPKFKVETGVNLIPPNLLPQRAANHQKYTIVGAGKTAMDSAVWLLDQGADPDRITWIAPRDSWLLNRKITQPYQQFFMDTIGGFTDQVECCRDATSIEDLFQRMEEKEIMVRINKDIDPEMIHYATISLGEIQQLQRIKDVVRGSRVDEITATAIQLSDGRTIKSSPDTLYIDCTATPIDVMPDPRPIFEEGRITIQALMVPNLSLSAAITAYVEAHGRDDEHKNTLCTPVAIGDDPRAWCIAYLGNMMNQFNWNQEPGLRDFIAQSRTDIAGKMIQQVTQAEPEKLALLERMKVGIGPAVANIQRLLADTQTA